MDLKVRWKELCEGFCSDEDLIHRRFNALNVAYTGKKRYYHNLDHISFMLKEYDLILDKVNNKTAFQLAIFYHDAIYDVKKKNNEEQSAALAVSELNEMNLSGDQVMLVEQFILATKTHEMANDSDTNLLVDIDMAILGQSWAVYEKYIQAIRKEYSIYPDFLYKKGRRAVLKHFLEMDSIFKSERYKERYEAQARSNIQQELDLLT